MLTASLITIVLMQAASADTTVAQTADTRPIAERASWADGASRTFVSTAIDAGYLYLRPRFSFGIGKPHYKWFGVDANPIVTNNALAAWVGVRAALPFFDVRAGARTGYSLRRNYLAPNDSYSRLELEQSDGGHAKYTTLEAELTGNVSTRYGDFGLLASISYVTGVPSGMFVFEEQLRVIIDPPWVWRVRGEYGFHPISGRRNVIVGPVVDVLGSPARDELLLRAGLTVRVVLSPALEVRGVFVPSIVSRDTIGLVQSDFTELGVRYRWASN